MSGQVKVQKRKNSQPERTPGRSSWLSFALVTVAVCATSVGVVMTTFSSRHLLNDLHRLELDRNALQVEWGKLLLEQSSLVAQGKVEDTALAELDMQVPAMEQVVVLTSE